MMAVTVTPARLAAWRGHAVAGMVVGALTIGMVDGGSLALWGIGGALLVFALAWMEQRPVIDWRVIGFGGALIALIVLADLTALSPGRSWAMSWRVVSVIVPLALLLHTARLPLAWPRWFTHAAWLVLAVAVVLLAEFLTHGGVLMPWLHFKNGDLVAYDRGLSYATVLVWPLCLYLVQTGRTPLAWALWCSLAAATWFSASRGAPLALAVGTGFGLLAWWRPKLGYWLALGLLAVMAAGIPLVVPWVFAHHPTWLNHLPVSWHHRFEIWDYMMAWDLRAPWVGHGLDAAGVVPVLVPDHVPYIYATGPAAHPHHAALQLWLELGPLGWLWAMVLAIFALTRMRVWPGRSCAAGMASWAAFVTLAGGAFSLWADSFLAVAGITIFWLVQSTRFSATISELTTR